MKFKNLYIFIYIFLFFNINILCQNEIYFSYINNKDFSIKNAVYIIRNREGNLHLEFRGITYLIKSEKKENIKNFLLIKDEENQDYFYIKQNSLKVILLSATNQNDNIINYKNDMEKDYSLWKITPKINEENKLVYYIQNKKTKKYWEINDSSKYKFIELKEVFNFNKNNEFQFNELYKEVQEKNINSNLLDKEPIDVLIKYIDLSDPKLNRTGIKQIKKDYDNEELKYSVRSILKNIPWIRKIFILMPNEKVKYFKPPEDINEKIIYIKDKDLLGFDTASPNIFQFNLFKMKKFGLSENFILMDDDYFIAEPLFKNNFFYEENGCIFPALVTSDYYEMNKDKIQNIISSLLYKYEAINPNSDTGFSLKQNRALLFLYEIFGNDDVRNGKKLIEPSFTHNAIPIKMSDVEEIYNNIMKYYQFANISFHSKKRTIYDLQMQTLYMAYVKNKYDRKVSKITSGYYDLGHLYLVKTNNKKLFVINTSIKSYSKQAFEKEKILLNKLFPIMTKYELNNEKNNSEIKNKNKKKKKNYKSKFFVKKPIKENISILINRIEYIIDKANIIINKTKKYEDNKDIEIDKKYLIKEIELLKKGHEWHRKINIVLFNIILLFAVYKIYQYYKIQRENINVQLDEEEIELKVI